MISIYKKDNFVWVDASSPSTKEINELKNEYNIPEIVSDEVKKKSARSRTDIYPDLIYSIMHFPLPSSPEDETLGEEINFIFGKDFLITIHTAPKLIKQLLEKSTEKEIEDKFKNPGELFSFMVENLFIKSQEELDSISFEIEAIEEHIFNGEEAEMVVFISETSRRLIDFRQSIQFHGEALSVLKDSNSFFGKSFENKITQLISTHEKITFVLSALRETLNELRITNDSLLTTKTNNTMKKLTTLAFITFPLALIAGIFGMNVAFAPILGEPMDFWIIIGLMFAVLILTALFFRIKKWM